MRCKRAGARELLSASLNTHPTSLSHTAVKFQSATYVATLVDRMAYIVRTGGEGADGDGEGRES